jgi:hypothetical protein
MRGFLYVSNYTIYIRQKTRNYPQKTGDSFVMGETTVAFKTIFAISFALKRSVKERRERIRNGDLSL